MKLQSAARAAILMSECGTGKTRVFCTTFLFYDYDREMAINSGKLTQIEGDRLFKPKLLVVPASIVQQCFTEISNDWAGHFDITCYYQRRQSVADGSRKAVTLDTVEELQKWIDDCADNHEDPMVSRNISFGDLSQTMTRLSTVT